MWCKFQLAVNDHTETRHIGRHLDNYSIQGYEFSLCYCIILMTSAEYSRNKFGSSILPCGTSQVSSDLIDWWSIAVINSLYATLDEGRNAWGHCPLKYKCGHESFDKYVVVDSVESHQQVKKEQKSYFTLRGSYKCVGHHLEDCSLCWVSTSVCWLHIGSSWCCSSRQPTDNRPISQRLWTWMSGLRLIWNSWH